MKQELLQVVELLEQNPTIGIPLGKEIYKLRIAIVSKGKGKSGGARILYFIQIIENKVLLFSLYNKGEIDNISDKDIQELIDKELE